MAIPFRGATSSPTAYYTALPRRQDLEGPEAADRPAEQPTKFEMAMNLKTAKAPGVTILQSVLIGADDVMPWLPESAGAAPCRAERCRGPALIRADVPEKRAI